MGIVPCAKCGRTDRYELEPRSPFDNCEPCQNTSDAVRTMEILRSLMGISKTDVRPNYERI
jgi:hypothetical protein